GGDRLRDQRRAGTARSRGLPVARDAAPHLRGDPKGPGRGMKPAPFEYARASSLSDAIALLASEERVAKPLAGGQSLGPMLNLRLAQPEVLVDITRAPELRRADEDDDGVLIGACVTHADIEDGRVPDPTGGALVEVAGAIAYRA